MIDIFLKEDVCKLLKNKTVVFLGDSNIRALYKDLLCLVSTSKFIPESTLRRKMEKSLYCDKLLSNGPKTNGRSYREERDYNLNNHHFAFFFLTCVYNEYVQQILHEICSWDRKPEVIIINSTLWDITRWGCQGVEKYKRNLTTLMREIKRLLPDCLVIWVTAPPIATQMKGGFLVKELQFLKYSLRFHVVEANYYARKVVVENGFDVLDSHYHLKMQIHRRCEDGIHWLSAAVRYVTNLLLTHISLAWNVPLPHRLKSTIMEEKIQDITADAGQSSVNNNEPSITTTSLPRVPPSAAQSRPTPEAKPTTTTTETFENFENTTIYTTSTPKRKNNKRGKKWRNPTPTQQTRPGRHVAANGQRESHHAFMSRQHREVRRNHYRQFLQPYLQPQARFNRGVHPGSYASAGGYAGGNQFSRTGYDFSSYCGVQQFAPTNFDSGYVASPWNTPV